MIKNTQKDKPYKLAVLRDRKGDLSKEWYIEFYAFNESEKSLVRKRVKIPQSYRTDKSRRKYANDLIKDINELLENGYYLNSQDQAEVVDTRQNKYMAAELKAVLKREQKILRSKTIGTYQTAINKFTDYFVVPIPLEAYTVKHSYRFKDHLLETGNSAATINKTFEHLHAIFNRIMEPNGIEKNPFDINKIKVLTESEANIALTANDRETLEKYLLENDYQLWLYTRFILFAFIRPKELRQIKVKHINLEQRSIIVPGTISKNRKSETVAIIPPLYEIIKEMDLGAYSPEWLLFGKDLLPGVIGTGENTPYNRHTIALRKLKLDGVGYTLYSWKHTGAVGAYLAGVGLKQLQRLLRHSSIQQTDTYLKSLGLRTDPELPNYSW